MLKVVSDVEPIGLYLHWQTEEVDFFLQEDGNIKIATTAAAPIIESLIIFFISIFFWF